MHVEKKKNKNFYGPHTRHDGLIRISLFGMIWIPIFPSSPRRLPPPLLSISVSHLPLQEVADDPPGKHVPNAVLNYLCSIFSCFTAHGSHQIEHSYVFKHILKTIFSSISHHSQCKGWYTLHNLPLAPEKILYIFKKMCWFC